jgi:hypothetical protein
MYGVDGMTMAATRGKCEQSVSTIIIITNQPGTFHKEFQALTMQQPTKLCCKQIKHEVSVLNKQRTNKKHHVLMVKWPCLAIVGGCGVRSL